MNHAYSPAVDVTIGGQTRIYHAFITTAPATCDGPSTLTLYESSFADVAGFTSVSEQHLREPAKVSAFIEAWSRGVTRIVWEHGGVFDKLVGDCIIGLFGPPFFEQSPAERAAACVRAAVAMAKFTREMIDDPACAPIKAAGAPLGIATGVNDCPASVGLFGIHTGWSWYAWLAAVSEIAAIVCAVYAAYQEGYLSASRVQRSGHAHS